MDSATKINVILFLTLFNIIPNGHLIAKWFNSNNTFDSSIITGLLGANATVASIWMLKSIRNKLIQEEL
ncbi:hypothetical protein H8356DRAFT_1696396 [Neocallimastix lanati (nom. inval.)]|nr:hypothetical protein H8356DRAFT_1696396 [Neocallimastix sp. JGI-2020a]